MTSPRAFSHIGLSVPNIDAAVRFYTDVLGFYTIMEPTEVNEDDSDIGQMCTDVFGAGWTQLRIAHLATADRIGFELFEFDGNSAPDDTLSFADTACFSLPYRTLISKVCSQKSWPLAANNACP
jgi:catechol 2,3-dioxygenase-like lactoylglutathione lyase family enzyme